MCGGYVKETDQQCLHCGEPRSVEVVLDPPRATRKDVVLACVFGGVSLAFCIMIVVIGYWDSVSVSEWVLVSAMWFGFLWGPTLSGSPSHGDAASVAAGENTHISGALSGCRTRMPPFSRCHCASSEL
jgi:hypothetical protein